MTKSQAYKQLAEHRLLRVEGFKNFVESEFVIMFKRLLPDEPVMETPLRVAEETVLLFCQFSSGWKLWRKHSLLNLNH